MLSKFSTKTIEYCSKYYTIKVEIEFKKLWQIIHQKLKR